MPVKDWYSIRAKQEGDETVAEIRIYDEIGFWGTTAKAFIEQLEAAAAGASRILVSINSPGGNVFDAFAIYNALIRHQLPVTTRVDGVAASAASMIFMAGDDRVMAENTLLMIHNMWGVVAGTADEMRNYADMMDKARDGAIAAYARSGQSRDEIIRMLDETTWMDALEAQSLGFASLMEEPVKIAASANAARLVGMLPGVPEDLLAQVQSSNTPKPPASPDPAAIDDPPEGDPPAPQADPTSDPSPDPDPTVEPGALAAHVFAACREKQIPQLAEGILVSGAVSDIAAADARIDEAVQISSLCLAAKLSDRATEFVTAGLSVEQVRARLFDAVVQAAESIQISNLQRPPSSAPTQSGPNPSAIYAARKAPSAK